MIDAVGYNQREKCNGGDGQSHGMAATMIKIGKRGSYGRDGNAPGTPRGVYGRGARQVVAPQLCAGVSRQARNQRGAAAGLSPCRPALERYSSGTRAVPEKS